MPPGHPPGPRSAARGAEKQTHSPAARCARPEAVSDWPGERSKETKPSSTARLQARPEVSGERHRLTATEKQRICPVTRPSAIASAPGLKSAARGAEKRTHSPSARTSAAAYRPGPKLVARGAEKQLPIQQPASLPSPPRRARGERREAQRSKLQKSCAPLRYRSCYRAEVNGERRREADSQSRSAPLSQCLRA